MSSYTLDVSKLGVNNGCADGTDAIFDSNSATCCVQVIFQGNTNVKELIQWFQDCIAASLQMWDRKSQIV